MTGAHDLLGLARDVSGKEGKLAVELRRCPVSQRFRVENIQHGAFHDIHGICQLLGPAAFPRHRGSYYPVSESVM